jgi:predicted cupin superfamily sugar epimerase
MAKIKLSEGGFSLIPEGVHTFKITEVEYKEHFGKMKVTMQTKDGKKHTEQFSLLTQKGEVNEGAVKAFSYFAKTALNNFNLDEIDDQDLVGCYITATVKHEEFESNKNPGKMLKSARLSDWTPAAGFGTGEAKSAAKAVEEDEDDLDDFLDD